MGWSRHEARSQISGNTKHSNIVTGSHVSQPEQEPQRVSHEPPQAQAKSQNWKMQNMFVLNKTYSL